MTPDGIRWFEQLSLHDTDLAGGKGANLGELTRAGIPVPPGFAVTSVSFRAFLDATGLGPELNAAVEALDVDDSAGLRAAADTLQAKVLAAPVPDDVRAQIVAAYAQLCQRVGTPEVLVAVRSSATVEDMPGTSFAGMNESFLNIAGDDGLIDAVRRCWASLYGARVLFYRRKQAIDEARVAIAVIVQQMVESEASGVMFTVHPATGDTGTIVVEGAFGLGDTVVGGQVSPDHWEIEKASGKLVVETIAAKHVISALGDDGVTRVLPLDADAGSKPCLTSAQACEVAALGKAIEAHYGSPQDIEWSRVDGKLYIVQSRPVTAVGGVHDDTPIVRGLPASPGVASGVVRVLLDLNESAQLLPGEILVARRTEPDWVPLMKRAAAIVTDEGGMTAHAAIVSRELGIPCIVGAQNATQLLRDGMEVTVDAKQGVVTPGRRAIEAAPAVAATVAVAAPIVTGTKLYVNLGQPELAERVAQADVDGVGLLRIEFLVLASTDNVHPRKLLNDGKGSQFRDGLVDGLARFARAFAPRPVVARATDFRTNEYRNMVGGDAFEPHEENPMIGYRGVFRYTKEPDLFRLEVEAFVKARDELGCTNLILMLPFVRTLSELKACKKTIDAAGYDGPLWIMAEVPSVVWRLEEYVREGVTGVSIGSNDLTQLVLGIDRDSEVLAPLFDERDPAVLAAIRQIVTECRRLGITCSICGQAPSVYPELAEKLVDWGIDSVSVNPDVIDRTRRTLAAAEQRILLRRARS